MEEKNRERLRAASTRLIQAVGKDQKKALLVLPYVEAISSSLYQQQIQNQHQMFQPAIQMIQQQQLQKVAQQDEKMRIAYRLAGFNPKDNPVTQEITRRFGSNIKHGELVGIAQAIADKAQIKLDRDAKRRKNVLLKWFAENWEIISPFLDYIVLEDNSEEEDGNNEPEKNDKSGEDDEEENNMTNQTEEADPSTTNDGNQKEGNVISPVMQTLQMPLENNIFSPPPLQTHVQK